MRLATNGLMSKNIPGYSELGLLGLNWSPGPAPSNRSADSVRAGWSRRRENLWQKLEESVPKTEDEWRRRRSTHGFTTSTEMQDKVNSLLSRECSDGARRVIDIAAAYVGRNRREGRSDFDQLRRLLENEHLSELTMTKYTSSVLKLMRLMDELFHQGLRHRAYEIFLLYMPLEITTLTHYGQNPERFKSCFAGCELLPEKQAELPLYLPFFVYHQLSQSPSSDITYEDICQALGTETYKKDDYECFMLKVLGARDPPLALTPFASAELGLDYDPIRDEIRMRRNRTS